MKISALIDFISEHVNYQLGATGNGNEILRELNHVNIAIDKVDPNMSIDYFEVESFIEDFEDEEDDQKYRTGESPRLSSKKN